MASNKITGKELRNLGYPEGRAIGEAVRVMEKGFRGKSRKYKLELLKKVVSDPEHYLKHDTLAPIAKALIIKTEHNETIDLKTHRTPYSIYGGEGIEMGAINQMEIAMKLPVTEAGALMPDAHQGYGLPIGGVLAARNAVIPYGVGVDIGCRMCLTVYDISENHLSQNMDGLKKMLMDNTRFGSDAFDRPMGDDVLDRDEFGEVNILKSLKDRAYQQIGSSGGGNHFVEFGTVEILDESNEFDLPSGKYLSVLSHS